MNNKHAYLIMVHNRIDSLNQLLTQLDSPHHDFYIHFDKKMPDEVVKKYEIKLKYSKVYKFSEINVSWADISQTKCQLFLLEKATERKYLYYHLLSGADYPLKSNEELYSFFNESKKEFVHFESQVINKSKKRFIDRYYLLQKYNRRVKIIDLFDSISLKFQKLIGINRCKKDELYACGANWFSITHELAAYIVSKKKQILKRYKFTRSSDEFYLQTLILNSNFKNCLYCTKFDDDYSANQRLIDWKRGNPYVFQEGDIEEIMKSGFCFVRKVNLDDNLRQLISERIKEGVK